MLTTEGTYPFILGGVSTWCDILINGIDTLDWQVLAITAGGLRRESLFSFPEHARLVGHVDLWSETVQAWKPFVRRSADRHDLPGELVRLLLGWNSEISSLIELLVWCHRNPTRIRQIFRSKRGWESFVTELQATLDEKDPEIGASPQFDVFEATELYQTLYWVARTAATPLPTGADSPDVLLVSAAGWAGIPAVVHQAMHGTPIILTEHGVYVREAYLNAIRTAESPAKRWSLTRLARGLSRLAYAQATVVAPVTNANAHWERAFGVPDERIRTIYNGVLVPPRIVPAPRKHRIVSVGRIDPLKDIKTMLRAAAAVLEKFPNAQFVHYGPVPNGNEQYNKECLALHEQLQLSGKFRFLGTTDDPYEVVQQSDIAFLSSRSEGFPVAVLEAMACGRPVVATAVGGVPEALAGCGFTAPPGDHEALAAGLLALLKDPWLADALGQRGHARVAQKFGQNACLDGYRRLIGELTGRDLGPIQKEDLTSVVLKTNELKPSPGDHDLATPANGGPMNTENDT